MTALAVVFAIGIVVATGAALLQAVGIRDRAAPTALAADFSAGVVVLAVLGMTTIALGGRLSPLPFYATLAALAGVVILRRRRPYRAPRGSEATATADRPPPGDRRVLALLVAAAFVWLVLLTGAMRDRLAWDGWAIWTLKARVLFENGTLPPAVLDPAGAYDYAHPDYPLAVPLLDWWLYRHAGAVRTALASVAGALWFGLLPVTVWRAARPAAGERYAALAALGITTFWPISFYAIGGYADVVLALAVLGAVIEIERAGRTEDPRAVGRFALFLTLAATAKNEGLVLAGIGSAVGLGVLLRRRDRRAGAYAALALPFVAWAPWFWFTRAAGLEAKHLSGAAPTWTMAIGRLPDIAAALVELGLTRAWIPLPFLVLTGFILALRRRGPALPAAWLIVIGYFLALMAVYMVTALDHVWLLDASLDRLIGTLVPAAVLLTLAALNDRTPHGRPATGDPLAIATGDRAGLPSSEEVG